MCCWQQQTGVGIVNGMQIYENIPRAQSQFLEKELVALPSLYCQRFSSSEEGTVYAMCERRSRGTDVWVCLPGASCSSYSLFLWRRWWQICAASCKAVVILKLVVWATVRQCVSWYWNRNHDNETDQCVKLECQGLFSLQCVLWWLSASEILWSADCIVAEKEQTYKRDCASSEQLWDLLCVPG